MTSKQVVDAVQDETLQVGMIRPFALPAGLQTVELFSEPLVALMHAGHRLADAGDEGLTLGRSGRRTLRVLPTQLRYGAVRPVAQPGAPRGLQSPHRPGGERGADHHRPVAAGLGVSVLPASFQRIRIDGVCFRTLLDKDATTAVWLVKRRQEQSPLAQAFMELVTREALSQP